MLTPYFNLDSFIERQQRPQKEKKKQNFDNTETTLTQEMNSERNRNLLTGREDLFENFQQNNQQF